ncbi:MAG: helix-turn-helix domain-containing protein [Nitrospirae bacterium]|nr:helix-turn-helix domain-containing protein [Nitrospirota bacterium]
MRISLEIIKDKCRQQNITLSELLKQAGVSRNVFYTLARKEYVLPKSIRAIAKSLNMSPSEFLTEDNQEMEKMKLLLNKVDEIARKYKNIDRDNIRHTLLLMREPPIERLRRALTRGQKQPHIQQK